MTLVQQIITVGMCILATLLTRFLPFAVFNARKPTPQYIHYLGELLPGAIFAMLVIYCLKDVGTDWMGIGLPKLAAVVMVMLSYHLSRNTLVSIFVGTAGYMLLIRLL